MLLLALGLILWMQISCEFGVSLIAPRKFSTEESYLQATVGVGFSDWEQDVEKIIKIKMWEIEGVGERDMERRRQYTRKMRDHESWENKHLIRLCYFSLFFWTAMSKQQLKHFPEFLLLHEGENFTTNCNSSSTFYSLQWYKQRPGGSPVLLMILAKGGEVKMEQRRTDWFGESRQHRSLHLAAAQLSDVGTYFWGRGQCSGSTCCLSPNLIVGSGVAPPHLSLEQGPDKAEVMMSMKKLNF